MQGRHRSLRSSRTVTGEHDPVYGAGPGSRRAPASDRRHCGPGAAVSAAPMQLWQMDVTASLFLADGRECKVTYYSALKARLRRAGPSGPGRDRTRKRGLVEGLREAA